jgi:hypothetical protein
MRDYGVTGMVTTAVKVGTGMLINGQDARWPHSQDGRATRLACDDAIRFKA